MDATNIIHEYLKIILNVSSQLSWQVRYNKTNRKCFINELCQDC